LSPPFEDFLVVIHPKWIRLSNGVAFVNGARQRQIRVTPRNSGCNVRHARWRGLRFPVEALVGGPLVIAAANKKQPAIIGKMMKGVSRIEPNLLYFRGTPGAPLARLLQGLIGWCPGPSLRTKSRPRRRTRRCGLSPRRSLWRPRPCALSPTRP